MTDDDDIFSWPIFWNQLTDFLLVFTDDGSSVEEVWIKLIKDNWKVKDVNELKKFYNKVKKVKFSELDDDTLRSLYDDVGEDVQIKSFTSLSFVQKLVYLKVLFMEKLLDEEDKEEKIGKLFEQVAGEEGVKTGSYKGFNEFVENNQERYHFDLLAAFRGFLFRESYEQRVSFLKILDYLIDWGNYTNKGYKVKKDLRLFFKDAFNNTDLPFLDLTKEGNEYFVDVLTIGEVDQGFVSAYVEVLMNNNGIKKGTRFFETLRLSKGNYLEQEDVERKFKPLTEVKFDFYEFLGSESFKEALSPILKKFENIIRDIYPDDRELKFPQFDDVKDARSGSFFTRIARGKGVLKNGFNNEYFSSGRGRFAGESQVYTSIRKLYNSRLEKISGGVKLSNFKQRLNDYFSNQFEQRVLNKFSKKKLEIREESSEERIERRETKEERIKKKLDELNININFMDEEISEALQEHYKKRIITIREEGDVEFSEVNIGVKRVDEDLVELTDDGILNINLKKVIPSPKEFEQFLREKLEERHLRKLEKLYNYFFELYGGLREYGMITESDFRQVMERFNSLSNLMVEEFTQEERDSNEETISSLADYGRNLPETAEEFNDDFYTNLELIAKITNSIAKLLNNLKGISSSKVGEKEEVAEEKVEAEAGKKTCPYCRKEIDENAKICPYCNKPLLSGWEESKEELMQEITNLYNKFREKWKEKFGDDDEKDVAWSNFSEIFSEKVDVLKEQLKKGSPFYGKFKEVWEEYFSLFKAGGDYINYVTSDSVEFEKLKTALNTIEDEGGSKKAFEQISDSVINAFGYYINEAKIPLKQNYLSKWKQGWKELGESFAEELEGEVTEEGEVAGEEELLKYDYPADFENYSQEEVLEYWKKVLEELVGEEDD